MFTLWLIISICLAIAYFLLQLLFYYQWRQTETITNTENSVNTSVAIIIPARNEAQNISNLLDAILQQDFPKELIEIIVVDDCSEDETLAIVQQKLQQNTFAYKVLELKNFIDVEHLNAYKKKAISIGVEQTNQELIITTDADCIVPKNWLKKIVQFYESTNANLIASPVLLHSSTHFTFFSRFQILDFCGMQLITAACIKSGIFNMGNGANLAYKKSAFKQVNGYEGINEKASGDDMLLVYKIAQIDNNKVFFNKNIEATTQTKIVHNLKSFLQQRFRWTSKAMDYQDKRMTMMLGMVLLFCVSMVVNFAMIIGIILYYQIFPNHTIVGYLQFLSVLFFLIVFSFQFVLKTIADYILLNEASSFFNEKRQLKGFIISEILHIAYIVYVGILGNFVSVKWKDRTVK